MVPGIILASGRSSRMGQPKALLTTGDGETFVKHLAHALCGGGVAEVLVVGRPEDAALRAEIERFDLPARFVENPGADGGQLTSILAGLRVADHPGVRAVLVTPVDLPLVTSSTVTALLDAFNTTAAPIVRAVHRGAHGHPVIFSRAVFGALRSADLALGAKPVLRAYEPAVQNVEVDDPGVLDDVDTPDDYKRVFGRLPAEA